MANNAGEAQAAEKEKLHKLFLTGPRSFNFDEEFIEELPPWKLKDRVSTKK